MDAFKLEVSFADRVRSAVIWRSGSQIAAQIVMWAVTVLVVRLLDPNDYGLFAMTQVVLVLFNFLSGYSFAASLIQAKSVTRERIAQIFGLLILLNLGLALLQLAAAPLAAAYFHQQMVADMLRVQALLYLPTPFIALPSALLARGLDFRKQAMVNLAGAVAGAATALACALSGWGVWTLVAAPLALSTVRAIGLTISARLLVWPSFNFRGAGDVLRFGGALLLAQLFWIVQSQADVFIGGRLVSAHNLGLYAEALFLTQILNAKFIPPLNEVAFPAYAQLGKDGGNLGAAFLTSVRLTLFVALPVYFGMAATAGPLVTTLFGPKWAAMAPLVATVALAMPFLTLQVICSPTTTALGRPSIYVTTGGAGAVIMPLAFLGGAYWGDGVSGIATAWLVAAPLLLAVTLWLTVPRIGVSLAALGGALMPPLAASAAMSAIVLAVRAGLPPLGAPATLAILVATGTASYALLLFVFARRVIDELSALLVRRKLPI